MFGIENGFISRAIVTPKIMAPCTLLPSVRKEEDSFDRPRFKKVQG